MIWMLREVFYVTDGIGNYGDKGQLLVTHDNESIWENGLKEMEEKREKKGEKKQNTTTLD